MCGKENKLNTPKSINSIPERVCGGLEYSLPHVINMSRIMWNPQLNVLLMHAMAIFYIIFYCVFHYRHVHINNCFNLGHFRKLR